MLKLYRNTVASISQKLNGLAELCIAISMVLIVLNILLRTVFNSPLAGLADYVGLLSALIVGFCFGVCSCKGSTFRS